ncbi:MAG TPA: sulfate adenylyltransferase subunit CysN [Acetobacteraceae bacterium]|jgi:bifunctional enzyme CysN/CysC|nr:sulfate adenylyltransferase subunit CysN [Acetobacteraceae bacterium]
MDVVVSAAPAAETLFGAQQGGLLRLMTCGSVDDGKSTLIGRLLHEAQQIQDDQLAALARDSRRHGTTGEEIDFALLMDGLEAEREQGITIDVAYRFATTAKRRFIIADAPGHEQYTRNMATAASNSELAIVLVDARKGVLTQTRRHSFIASLVGVRHIVLAVNKMDLVDFDHGIFQGIARDYAEAVATAGFKSVAAIPISARYGDNVVGRSRRMSWYTGPTLLDYLESVEVEDERRQGMFRMPVQWVNRPNGSFRGYCGTIASGVVRVGHTLAVSGSKMTGTLARIVTLDGDRAEAGAGDAVTLVLSEERDISRGDVLSHMADPVPTSDQFSAHLIWLSDVPLMPGRAYLIKLGTRTVSGSVTRIRHRIDVNTREKLSADTLGLNDVAKVQLSLDRPVAFQPYAESRDLGGLIIIDRQTNATAGVGMIEFALTRAANITWHALDVDRMARAQLKGQSPAVVWFTGLSGSGKSTIANLVEKKLHGMGRHTYMLDGDNVRHGLNRDLGFTEADRVENIRRVSEVSALFADAGLIVLVSFISPYAAEREAARQRLQAGEFVEVFVDTPVDECRRRDPKGLYTKADQGLIRNFTGVSAPYEPPSAPEVHLKTIEAAPEELADQVIEALARRGMLG